MIEDNTKTNKSSYMFVLILGATLLYIVVRKYYRMFIVSKNIPGPSFVDYVTVLFQQTIKADPIQIFKVALQLKPKFPEICKVWIGPKLTIFLFNPADIEIILSSSVYIDKSKEYEVFKPWFGNGLLISTGSTWKHHRKMIAPTFHQSILKSFMNKFNELSLNVVDQMKDEHGTTFDCHKYMSGITVDILLETAMGYDEPRTKESGYNYAHAVMRLCELLHRRHYQIHLRSNFIFEKISNLGKQHAQLLNVIRGVTTKVVKNKNRQYIDKTDLGYDSNSNINTDSEEFAKNVKSAKSFHYARDDLDDVDENDVGEKKRLPFIDQLTVNAMSEDVNFSEQDVLDQVNTILFEGHDTTAAGSSFFLCLMGIHKDIQQKVFDEQYKIFGDSDRLCTFVDTLEMNYLERTIMETLRVYPPVPLIAREVREDVKLASGDYQIPVGATIVIPQYVVHRRADTYPNPEKFDPDNFLPDRCQERHYYSYIPFSAGPRSCVGRKYAMLKLKVLLSTIIRKYIVHCDMKEKDFQLQADIILKIGQGFQIRLEPRLTNINFKH